MLRGTNLPGYKLYSPALRINLLLRYAGEGQNGSILLIPSVPSSVENNSVEMESLLKTVLSRYGM